MGIRQLLLDVDKASERPKIYEISAALEKVAGVEGISIVVNEIDMETVGMEITIEGDDLQYPDIVAAIEKTGAVVHSLDQLIAGKRIITPAHRSR